MRRRQHSVMCACRRSSKGMFLAWQPWQRVRTADVVGVVQRVLRVGLLVGRADAVGVALELAQELVLLNLCQQQQ